MTIFGGAFTSVVGPGISTDYLWYDPHGDALPCVAAYRGLGATSLDESKVNLANPGTYDLTPINGTPQWGADRGWYGAGIVCAWSTGIITSKSNWSVVARFANEPFHSNGMPFGVDTAVGHAHVLGASPNYGYPGWELMFYNYGYFAAVPPIATGIIGIAAERCFVNGLYAGDIIGFSVAVYGFALYLLGLDDGGQPPPHNPLLGDLYSFSCYSTQLTDSQMAAVSAGHAALKPPAGE